MKFGVLTRPVGLAVAVTLAVLLAAPAAAQNGDRDRGDYQGRWDSQGRANRQRGYERSPQWHDWHSYRGYGYHDNSGAIVGGALLGLGVGAALAARCRNGFQLNGSDLTVMASAAA